MDNNVFSGLSDREMALALVTEMRRRGLYGCVFLLPETGGPSVFGSSSPAGTMSTRTAAEQLAVFAEVATYSQGETTTKVSEDLEATPAPRWVN